MHARHPWSAAISNSSSILRQEIGARIGGNFQSLVEPGSGVLISSLCISMSIASRIATQGVYLWQRATRTLKQLHRANVERVAAYLSLEQALAGNSCFTVSMIANLAEAAKAFGNRGYRYVHFEAGAIGQRLYLGAEALNWNATGIGAFYDDDVHRYLGLLEESDGPVEASVNTAEQKSLVMLHSPASRHAAGQIPTAGERTPAKSSTETSLPRDSRTLAQQVIYHFAVGRAVPDPRLDG